MSSKAAIKDALKKLVTPNGNAYSVICTVDSVNLTDNTCYCIAKNGTGDIQGVRLMAKNEVGFLIIPAVDSDVMVSFMTDSSAYVSMFSELTEIQLNGDTYDGLVKVADLVTKLNVLETHVNAMKVSIAAILAAGIATPGTPVTNGTLAALFAGFNVTPLTLTVQANLENTTVNHGNGT